MNQDPGFGLAGSTFSEFCYAGIQVSVGAAVLSVSSRERSVPKAPQVAGRIPSLVNSSSQGCRTEVPIAGGQVDALCD